jgi:hypothetical protein
MLGVPSKTPAEQGGPGRAPPVTAACCAGNLPDLECANGVEMARFGAMRAGEHAEKGVAVASERKKLSVVK